MQRGGFDPGNVVLRLMRQFRCFSQQLRKAEDAAKRFVEFVGDARRQLADRRQPVGMPQFRVQPFLFRRRLAAVDDQPHLPHHFFEQFFFLFEERDVGGRIAHFG